MREQVTVGRYGHVHYSVVEISLETPQIKRFQVTPYIIHDHEQESVEPRIPRGFLELACYSHSIDQPHRRKRWVTLRPAMLAPVATLRSHDRQNESLRMSTQQASPPQFSSHSLESQRQLCALPSGSPTSPRRLRQRFGDPCACLYGNTEPWSLSTTRNV